MKKLVKFVMGAAAVAGTVCGVLYFMKKVLGLDILGKDNDDFDDDGFDEDFDDIDDDDDSDDREYVTLDMEEENSGEDAGQETEETETPAMEAEAE